MRGQGGSLCVMVCTCRSLLHNVRLWGLQSQLPCGHNSLWLHLSRHGLCAQILSSWRLIWLCFQTWNSRNTNCNLKLLLSAYLMLIKSPDWSDDECVRFFCPVCGGCVRWPSQHICVFFHLMSTLSLLSFSPCCFLLCNHYNNKGSCSPARQWKGSTRNAKIYVGFFPFSRLLVCCHRGTWVEKLDWKSGKKGIITKRRKAPIHPRQQSPVISAVISLCSK